MSFGTLGLIWRLGRAEFSDRDVPLGHSVYEEEEDSHYCPFSRTGGVSPPGEAVQKGERGAFNLQDVQDTIGSLQTIRQYSLCDKCRGRAGVRWCLPAADPPGILHILQHPSTARPRCM